MAFSSFRRWLHAIQCHFFSPMCLDNLFDVSSAGKCCSFSGKFIFYNNNNHISIRQIYDAYVENAWSATHSHRTTSDMANHAIVCGMWQPTDHSMNVNCLHKHATQIILPQFFSHRVLCWTLTCFFSVSLFRFFIFCMRCVIFCDGHAKQSVNWNNYVCFFAVQPGFSCWLCGGEGGMQKLRVYVCMRACMQMLAIVVDHMMMPMIWYAYITVMYANGAE